LGCIGKQIFKCLVLLFLGAAMETTLVAGLLLRAILDGVSSTERIVKWVVRLHFAKFDSILTKI
jgi:hypothetical protein